MDSTQNKEAAPIASPVLKPKPGYVTRLFSGRLNRQNYIIGSTLLSLPPMICFLIVIYTILTSTETYAMPYLNNPSNPTGIIIPQVSLLSLLQTPVNEFWSALGILFIIISIPYLFSLQIRLHDLNLNGWLWTINFVPLVSFYTSPIPGMYTPKPTVWFVPLDVIALLANLFMIYVTVWHGTDGPNKYGDKPLPRTSLLLDILEVK
jgi:uncharacterized membrane protein YhaH (DUF805 family)